MESDYETNVFLNCPLDATYRPLLDAIVFAIYDCGFVARAALEVTDASQVRIDKISGIIADCKFGVHDICRTEIDLVTGLPRFNMPLELGLFLGAKRFGSGKQKLKNCLVLDVERYRYQKFMSDIAGQDIAAHDGTPEAAIRAVRDWLSDAQHPREGSQAVPRCSSATGPFAPICPRCASGAVSS
ncbi:MAG TPA: hypothetical protein VM733_20850 [Thermoanaerobaculia bacterium]|nr:hypothetical protein [Thermoanaerobaculia bacterium]